MDDHHCKRQYDHYRHHDVDKSSTKFDLASYDGSPTTLQTCYLASFPAARLRTYTVARSASKARAAVNALRRFNKNCTVWATSMAPITAYHSDNQT